MAKRHNKSTYRSGLEDRTVELLNLSGVKYEYEPKWGKLEYTKPAKLCTYTPDFYVTTKSGKQIVIETKGIWDADDRAKHLIIRQAYPDLDLRFVFSNSRAKIRKGSRTTYGDVCNGLARAPFKGVIWKYADKRVPDSWLEE